VTDPAAKTSANAPRLILATRTAGLPERFGRSGFHPCESDAALEILEAAGLWFGPRAMLEDAPEFRQIIPYVILKLGDRFVRYTRTPAGGEARLHGKTSIGLGGHIDLPDAKSVGDRFDLAATAAAAARRELDEELGAPVIEGQDWIGLLVDNDSEVGRVHIGLVGLWTVHEPVRSAEDAIAEIGLCTLHDLHADRDRLEGWSQLVLPYLGEPGGAALAA
jgi:predicted NUDIX family phosphoesterase